MAKRKGNYVAGPGRDPLFNEPMVRIPGTVPESYKEHLIKRAAVENISMAEYLRRLIAADMEKSTK